jgi:hypothetical protein
VPHEGDLLLRLDEEVVGVTVPASSCRSCVDRDRGSYGEKLGGVEEIEKANLCSSLTPHDDLHAELVLREGARLTIASKRSRRWKSESLPTSFTRLVPDQRVHSEERLPVELDEARRPRR